MPSLLPRLRSTSLRLSATLTGLIRPYPRWANVSEVHSLSEQAAVCAGLPSSPESLAGALRPPPSLPLLPKAGVLVAYILPPPFRLLNKPGVWACVPSQAQPSLRCLQVRGETRETGASGICTYASARPRKTDESSSRANRYHPINSTTAPSCGLVAKSHTSQVPKSISNEERKKKGVTPQANYSGHPSIPSCRRARRPPGPSAAALRNQNLNRGTAVIFISAISIHSRIDHGSASRIVICLHDLPDTTVSTSRRRPTDTTFLAFGTQIPLLRTSSSWIDRGHLPPGINAALFRICSESLTRTSNVVGASRHCHRRQREIRAKNGNGLPTDAARAGICSC